MSRPAGPQGSARIEGDPAGGLPPWREVITPYPDVAGVALREGSSEYNDPGEFYRRIYVTEGLGHLLVEALKRLSRGAGSR